MIPDHPFYETAVERMDRIRANRMEAGWGYNEATQYAIDEHNSLMGNLRGPCDWRHGKSFKD